MWVAFANAKATHIFSKNINIYAIINDESFNDTLTNDIVSFEKLGPGLEFKGCDVAIALAQVWYQLCVMYINASVNRTFYIT